jgi:ABC-2 type transport system permease protein
LAEDIGWIIVGVFQNIIPVLIIGSLFFGFPLPASLSSFGLFLLSVQLSFWLNWLFAALFSMLSYKVINMWSMFGLKWNMMTLLSGSIIPIWFFPSWLQTILGFLPFVHIYQAPLGIYIGRSVGFDAWKSILLQTVWVVILIVSFFAAKDAARKHILVQGG